MKINLEVDEQDTSDLTLALGIGRFCQCPQHDVGDETRNRFKNLQERLNLCSAMIDANRCPHP